jgi:hypothetical protein
MLSSPIYPFGHPFSVYPFFPSLGTFSNLEITTPSLARKDCGNLSLRIPGASQECGNLIPVITDYPSLGFSTHAEIASPAAAGS